MVVSGIRVAREAGGWAEGVHPALREARPTGGGRAATVESAKKRGCRVGRWVCVGREEPLPRPDVPLFTNANALR